MGSVDKNSGSCEGTPAPSDVLVYDTEKGAEQLDVMGYEPGGPENETDAMAYDRPVGTPENDAFMKPEKC